MKSYIEWYRRKSQIRPLSLYQIIRTFLPYLEKIDHVKIRFLMDYKLWVEYFGKLKKQLPTWLAKIVNILIVLGALLSILACPIWVHPYLKIRRLLSLLPRKKWVRRWNWRIKWSELSIESKMNPERLHYFFNIKIIISNRLSLPIVKRFYDLMNFLVSDLKLHFKLFDV